MMKVFLISENLSDEWGGPAKSVASIARLLKENNIDYEMLTTYSGCKYKNEVSQKYNLNIRMFKTIGPSWLKFSPGLFLYLVRNGSGCIFHLNNLWNFVTLFCYCAARLNRCKLIVSPRGALESWSLKEKKQLKDAVSFAFQKKMLKKSFIHVTADSEKNSVQNYLGTKDIATSIIPNGVDIVDFDADISNNRKVKTFLFMSRLHRKKGLLELLEAWEVFSSNKPDVKLLIAGTGEADFVSLINSCIEKKGLENSVMLLGMVKGDDKKRLLVEADYFVLPTHSENFGIVVAEAAACKLPIITTTGAPWSKIVDYKCGFWINLSVNELTTSLENFYSLSEEAKVQMGNNAFQMVSDNYSWASLSDDYLDMYRRLSIK